jgi:hypothetical protein
MRGPTSSHHCDDGEEVERGDADIYQRNLHVVNIPEYNVSAAAIQRIDVAIESDRHQPTENFTAQNAPGHVPYTVVRPKINKLPVFSGIRLSRLTNTNMVTCGSALGALRSPQLEFALPCSEEPCADRRKGRPNWGIYITVVEASPRTSARCSG